MNFLLKLVELSLFLNRFRLASILKIGLLIIGAGLGCISCAQRHKPELNLVEIGRSIVQVQAISAKGKQNMGSGVVIAPNTIATNCHVTRAAKRVYLIKEDRLYPVLAQSAKPEFDVCILKAADLDLPVVNLADDEPAPFLENITMYGYPFGLNLRMISGKIIALHPYAGVDVIEINTGFNFGASGGGVFNKQGELVGLMTFMGRDHGAVRFYAIPVAWLRSALQQAFLPLETFSTRSFWEKNDFKPN